jgi:hypothetical protein
MGNVEAVVSLEQPEGDAILLHNLSRAAVVGVAIAASAVALSSASSGSGLRGLVTKGPTQPVCVVGKPCSAPAPGVRLSFTRNSATRSVVTDSQGRYFIRLRPGAYSVEITGAKFGFRPRTVSVTAGRFKTANFAIDTGIR